MVHICGRGSTHAVCGLSTGIGRCWLALQPTRDSSIDSSNGVMAVAPIPGPERVLPALFNSNRFGEIARLIDIGTA